MVFMKYLTLFNSLILMGIKYREKKIAIKINYFLSLVIHLLFYNNVFWL
jgi:hypothetical protein